jgi:hypothetical protein
MSYYPAKKFVNNEIPTLFNLNTFKTDALQSDNIITNILNVTTQASLPTLSNLASSPDITDNSNRIATTSYTKSYVDPKLTNLTSSTIANSGTLTSNTITSTNLLTASNGLTVTSGTITLVANAIALDAVSGLSSRLLKLDNLTGSTAINSTISSNTLTINYATNNGQSLFVAPTANFSLVLTGVPTTILNAVYKLEIYCSAKFYCNAISVNGTVLTLFAVGGFSNIASQVNASATGLIQQFIIFFTGTTTPSRVNTMLLSTW